MVKQWFTRLRKIWKASRAPMVGGCIITGADIIEDETSINIVGRPGEDICICSGTLNAGRKSIFIGFK